MEKSQPYVFSGKGNYGGKPVTREELIEAYNSAPACHHPARTMPEVALNQLSREDQAAIIANREAEGLDAELRALED